MTNEQSQTAPSPRLVTTGGNYPPTKHNLDQPKETAHIDLLAITVLLNDVKGISWLSNELMQFLPTIQLHDTGRGWQGYQTRIEMLYVTPKCTGSLGFIAFGGDSQRGTSSIQLNAQACSLITDWPSLKAWCEQNASKITRIDLAHDDMTGEVLTIAKGIQWLQDGLFSNNGVREGMSAIKGRLIDDLGSGDGKTLYVGNRKSGKMLRIYEKGKQLGDILSTWVRAEVELKTKTV